VVLMRMLVVVVVVVVARFLPAQKERDEKK